MNSRRRCASLESAIPSSYFHLCLKYKNTERSPWTHFVCKHPLINTYRVSDCLQQRARSL